MSSKPYEQMLRDSVFMLVEKTRVPSIYGDEEFDRGYLQALHSVLSLIRGQIDVFDLDRTRAGLGDFDPEEWRQLGPLYWDTRPSGRRI